MPDPGEGKGSDGAPDPGPELHVVQSGRDVGVPALLLHGFTGCAAAWGRGVLDEVGRHRRLLAIDLPGHGRSRGPGDPAGYGIERVVEDVVRVLDERGVERADWIGYSMGGRVAIAGAVLQPDRVRRLVLESTSPGIEDPDARARRRTEDEALARRIEKRGVEWFVDRWMELPLFETQKRLPAHLLEEARRRRLQNRSPGLAAALRGLGTGAQRSYWDELARLEHPTLVLTGVLDLKYTELGARMARELRHGVHRSVPGAGHTIHLEAPTRWLEEVLAFLDGP